ncbi:MAG: polysaccharide biosynthesis tyrosine autokinase [Candidatus Eremiobacteraeota bacterium]|nr:polysaccharide biosynthesis tyrosine autokinase [Candidatus Eremiobacteraeota bacterium]
MQAIPGSSPYALTGGVEPSGSTDRQRELASLWRTLIRRRSTILRIFVGFVLLMLIGTLVWPKQYTSEIKLITGNSNNAAGTSAQGPDSQLPVLNALMLAGGMQTNETYAELFQETPVVQRVISDVNLKVSPRTLLGHVVIKPVTNTAILSVAVTWGNRNTASAIANAFGKAIVERQRDLVSSQARAAIDSLKTQLPQAQSRMNDAQSALSSFEAKHRIANIDQQTTNTITNMATLDAKVGQVQADRQQAQAQLASSQAQLSGMSPTITGSTTTSANPVVAQLQQQLTQVDVQLRTARQQYTEQHPEVIALKAQEAQLQSAIAQQQRTVVSGQSQVPNPVYQGLAQQSAGYRAQVAADSAQITELQRQSREMAPILAALPSQTAQLADLQRSAKASQDVYSALQSKFVNAQVASETALSDVTITQPALASQATVRPSLLLNFLISLVLGAVLGVTGALLLDYLDNSIKDERQVEEELSLPQLGAIPLVQLRNGEAIVPWVKALALESFLQLVTNMKYATDVPLRSLAVISPQQGDGKSTIALNIALAMNEIEGPVLLVDGDLRRPSLHAKLRMPNERGLSDVLVGASSLDSAVQVDDRSGLAVLTSGTATPNPIKLLESTRFDALMDELYQKYRTVVFDGAALVGNVDSAVIARRVSGTVLVLSHGSTDLREASGAMKRLQRMGVRNILGFVLNRTEARRADYTPYGEDVPRLYSDDAPIVAASQ